MPYSDLPIPVPVPTIILKMPSRPQKKARERYFRLQSDALELDGRNLHWSTISSPIGLLSFARAMVELSAEGLLISSMEICRGAEMGPCTIIR